MVPLFLILVGFLMLLMTIFQQLDPALPMKFLQMIIIMIKNKKKQQVQFFFFYLNKLCRSKATGLDNISAKIIRECANLISVSLCDLFNKSLLSGIFPSNWKCARVTPLFKQGEASDLNNYRPISIISVIAKVFERIMFMTNCIIF